MLATITALSVFESRLATAAAEARPSRPNDPAVEAEIAHWRGVVPAVRTVSDLTADPRVLALLGRAFGFTEADMPDKILIDLALTGGASDPSAGASRNADYRLTEMARVLGFAEYGAARLSDGTLIAQIEARYRAAMAEPTRAPSVPVTREGIEADYFRANIANVQAPEDLLADFRLYAFAATAFGVDPSRGAAPAVETALRDGVDAPSDAAIRRGERGLIEMVGVFGLGEGDIPRTGDPAFADGIIRRYTEQTGTLIGTTSDVLTVEQDTDEASYFREAVRQVGSIDELLDDRRLYAFLMTAFDLGGELDKRGLVKTALTEGGTSAEAFAQRFSDPRYRELTRSVGIAEFGLSNLRDPLWAERIITRYERVDAEIQLAETDPAAAEAAYFKRKAGTISSWFGVMADTRLRDVVFTALELPLDLAALDLDRVVRDLDDRYPVGNFADPDEVQRFVERFAALNDAQQGPGTTATSGAATILSGGASAGTLYSLVAQLAVAA